MANRILTMLIFSYCMIDVSAYAFNDTLTHRDLTLIAVEKSSLNTYLVTFVGYSSGVKKVLTGKDRNNVDNKYRVEKWLQEGSTDEDKLNSCRASSHFHNPIFNSTDPDIDNWDGSKMSDSLVVDNWCALAARRYSDVTLATGYLSPTGPYIVREGQDMGWDNARTYFYEALTTTVPAVKEEKIIKTFRSVGMVMHLLQDMAVPAHVRNDMSSHLINKPWWVISAWGSNPFEKYVFKNDKPMNIIMSTTTDVDKPIFSTPMRLTDFWDKNIYTGENPSITLGSNIGIAEYTNANFVSDFTIFKPESDTKHFFKYPNQATSVDKVHYTIPDPINPGQTISRTYYQKTRDGDEGYRLAGVGFLNRWSVNWTPLKRIPPMDNYVHDDYAKKLLPRAVGYSAALLDYFFRGKIDLQVASGTTFRTINVTARNTTDNNETMPSGEVSLVIRYKELLESGTGPMRTLNFPPDDEYKYRVIKLTNPLEIPRDSSIQLSFDLSADPLPLHIGDVTLQLVYKGKLGNEEGAVAVGSTPLPGLGTNIGISLPAAGVFAKTTGSNFTGIDLIAESDITGALTGGIIELVLEYQLATSDPFASLPVDCEPQNAASYIIRLPEKNGVNTLTQGVATALQFDLSAAPLPLWATDVYMNVVYRRIGVPEAKPIAVGHRDISEPTPVDIFNNTDYSCISNTWYTAGSPEALTAADQAGNQNGSDDDADIFHHNFTNVYAKASSIVDPLMASANSFDFFEPGPVSPNNLKRMGFILTDYSFKYSFLPNWVHIDQPQDGWTRTEAATLNTGTAVKNQTDSELNYVYPGMYNMRGKPMWWGTGIIYNTKLPANSSCDWSALP